MRRRDILCHRHYSHFEFVTGKSLTCNGRRETKSRRSSSSKQRAKGPVPSNIASYAPNDIGIFCLWLCFLRKLKWHANDIELVQCSDETQTASLHYKLAKMVHLHNAKYMPQGFPLYPTESLNGHCSKHTRSH